MVSKRNTKLYVKYNTNKLKFTLIFVFLTNTLYSIHASMSCALHADGLLTTTVFAIKPRIMVGFQWNRWQTIRHWILYRLHVCIALQWPFLRELWLCFRKLFTLLCESGILNPTETFCNLEYGFKKKYKIVCQIQYK